MLYLLTHLMTAVTVTSLKVSMRMLVKKHLVHVTVLGTWSAQLILIALMFAKHSTCKISWTPPDAVMVVFAVSSCHRGRRG